MELFLSMVGGASCLMPEQLFGGRTQFAKCAYNGLTSPGAGFSATGEVTSPDTPRNLLQSTK